MLNTPDLSFWQRLNKIWWLQRIPMMLLAIPSAYGVGAFAATSLPIVFAIVAGCAFEAAYIGAIALADQQHDMQDRWTTALWILVNLFAVLASALCNLLFFADGSYAAITAEVATHGIPMPVLAFFYGLLLHRMSVKQAQEQAEAGTQIECPNCHRMLTVKPGGNPMATLNGHKTHCKP
jgi:hypothetical protein